MELYNASFHIAQCGFYFLLFTALTNHEAIYRIQNGVIIQLNYECLIISYSIKMDYCCTKCNRCLKIYVETLHIANILENTH